MKTATKATIKLEPEEVVQMPTSPLSYLTKAPRIKVSPSPNCVPWKTEEDHDHPILPPKRRRSAFDEGQTYRRAVRPRIADASQHQEATFAGDDKNNDAADVIVVKRVRFAESHLCDDTAASMDGRLRSLGPPVRIKLDPAIRDAAFTRLFISRKWGGATQDTIPRLSPATQARLRAGNYGATNFMFVNPLYNPAGPRNPGQHGMYFTIYDTMGGRWKRGNMLVFVRLEKNAWQLLGCYEFVPLPPLSTHEWNVQSQEVRTAWAGAILKNSWGKDVRVRISLRGTLGREPTEEETDKAVNSCGKFSGISVSKIIRAFDEGKEVMGVWGMRCVRYPESFQRKLMTDSRDWKPPVRKEF